MFAFMNAEALRLTIEDGEAHFYSRSRDRLWKKGEESGNVLRVSEIRTDCDQDVVWLAVTIDGHGVACHTGRSLASTGALSPTQERDPTPSSKIAEWNRSSRRAKST